MGAVFASFMAMGAVRAQLPQAGQGPIDGLPPERVVRVKVPPPRAADTDRPFEMGFEFNQVLTEEGSLAHPHQSARSIGLRFVFFEGKAVRQHFAIAHQWERLGNVVRQGFRIDLLALGFPIPVFDGAFRVEIEPILRPVRGHILFEDQGTGEASRSLLRFESGFALGLRVGRGIWYLGLEPLSIDFRTVVATRNETRVGLSRVWSMTGVLGRDF